MKTNTANFSVVIPLYNEEDVLPKLIQRLSNLSETIYSGLNKTVEFVFINDGSSDNTLNLLTTLARTDLKKQYKIVNLSRNFGHQPAVLAGLNYAQASDAIMIIDGDLQDPPELIIDMYYEMTKEQCEVVYAVRQNRKEGPIKKMSYSLFYKIINSLTNGLIPRDSGDFALISPKICDILINLPEKEKFLRGLRAWVGFKQTPFYYSRDERKFGTTKYPFRALLNLAKSGIFNFTNKPLQLINRIGIFSTIIGVIYFFVILMKVIFNEPVVPGFTSTIAVVIFFSGVQMMSLGLIAEYIGRLFLEIKSRPTYIIDCVISNNSD
jgi:glycosyltransferase involved in cell wall biosynthesis